MKYDECGNRWGDCRRELRGSTAHVCKRPSGHSERQHGSRECECLCGAKDNSVLEVSKQIRANLDALDRDGG